MGISLSFAAPPRAVDHTAYRDHREAAVLELGHLVTLLFVVRVEAHRIPAQVARDALGVLEHLHHRHLAAVRGELLHGRRVVGVSCAISRPGAVEALGFARAGSGNDRATHHEADEEDDVGPGARRDGDGSLDGVSVAVGLAGERLDRPRRLRVRVADRREHGHAAVLDLGLAHPLDVPEVARGQGARVETHVTQTAT